MFRSYLIIAFRNLWRKKAFSSMNIAGLAIGIAASLLMFVVIHWETSFDGWQSKKDRICRVVTTYVNHANGEVKEYQSATPVPLSAALKNDIPLIERTSPVWNIGGAQIHVPGPKGLEDEKIFKEERGLFFVEPDFFRIFDYEWLAGNAARINEPHVAVISERLAKTYFGDARSAIGKTIEMWSFRIRYQVAGVFKDLPPNTDMEVSFAGSYITFRTISGPGLFNDWNSPAWPSQTYVLLKDKHDLAAVNAALPRLVAKYYPEDQMKGSTRTQLSLQALPKMHLDEHFLNWKGDALTKKELWALGLIGTFLLLVACINFVNLATAQSVSRAKEIGVRKVLGSSRPILFRQFLQETGLICFISLALGCVLATLFLPMLSALINKPLKLDFLQPAILCFLLGVWLFVTFLAGFYPGIVISRFNPIEALKSKISSRTVGGISLRRGLVVMQFVIAQLLVIGTLVVIKQMKFFRNQPLGFEKKAIAMVELPSDSLDATRYGYLKEQIQKVPGIAAVSFCMDVPASWGWPTTEFMYSDEGRRRDFPVAFNFADTGYFNTYKIGLVAGRLPYASDTMREILVNESMVRRLGLKSPSEILGKTLQFKDDFYGPKNRYPVVGVMHDFHSRPLQQELTPLAMSTNKRAYNWITVRVEADRMDAVLDKVHAVFTSTFPHYMYDLHFFDERLESFYNGEARTSQLFKVFAVLAIFISCLGLYGLVSYMAVQKTKEVGIRKVLGASIRSIVMMFSRELTILIGLAFLIAAPVGYYLMHQWLSGFYYHVSIGWGVFALSIVLSIGVAWMAVGYKAIRAAVANPVKSLRTE